MAALLGSVACGSLLGIEDIHEGPAPGAEAGASHSGAGGVVDAAGAANPNGGKAGAGQSSGAGGVAVAGSAGAAGSAGTAGSAGSGGSSAGAGGSTAGAGGSTAGAGGSTAGAGGASSTVHGVVIDYWGHKIPGVAVMIDGKLTSTDAQGAFSAEGVAAEYDVTLSYSFLLNAIRKRGWAYQGLTRRDPTLQVYDGLPSNTAALDIQPNQPALLTSERTLFVALGGPHGASRYSNVSGAGTDGTSVIWQGPTEIQQTAHGLIWQKDQTSGFPTTFWAYDSTLVGLSAGVAAHSKASFNLSADTITTGSISGTVSGSGFTDRYNSVFLRFATNAVMELLSHHPAAPGFSYVVPTIAQASATFAASNGDVYSDYGVVHRDGLTANTALINVTIPTPARGLAVTPDANAVSAATQFSFTTPSSASVPFLATFVRNNPDERFFVLSAKAPFKVPKFVNGAFTPTPGATYTWRVETHGSPASVDAMAGPTGFLDSFSNTSFNDEPTGPRIADGSFTLSTSVSVKIAP